MFKLTPFSTTPRKRDDFLEFTEMFDDFFRVSPFRRGRYDSFKLDVRDEDKHYLIEADLPGVKKDELKVSYNDQVLTIAIERKEEKEAQEENYLHRERYAYSMQRSINLPDVDPSKVKARLEEGVLKVVAEKSDIQERSTLIDVE